MLVHYVHLTRNELNTAIQIRIKILRNWIKIILTTKWSNEILSNNSLFTKERIKEVSTIEISAFFNFCVTLLATS